MGIPWNFFIVSKKKIEGEGRQNIGGKLKEKNKLDKVKGLKEGIFSFRAKERAGETPFRNIPRKRGEKKNNRTIKSKGIESFKGRRMGEMLEHV